MSKIKSTIPLVGKVDNLSAYKMKGIEDIVIRRRGGASKNKIQTSPTFERTRENYTEFGGVAKAASNVRWALAYVRHLADHNITPILNALCKIIQLRDTVRPRGQRTILFSQCRFLLEGFNLNKHHPFDSVVRYPVHCSINRETGTAVVQLPNLLPGVNMILPWKYPMFRFIVAMGVIDDREYNYEHPAPSAATCVLPLYTEWQMAQQIYAGDSIELKLNDTKPLTDAQTIVVSVGIEMGMPMSTELICPVKYAGCAKLITTG
jgi:hypothetical protein